MKLRLDKSGRMLLPKSLRQRVGLKAGSEFEVTEAPEGIFLRTLQKRSYLIKRGGFLVHMGQASRSLNWQRCFSDLEQERLRDILGS
jgi:AbrB family looped-hinge helix DNA binding protein